MLAHGADIAYVAKQLGHSSPAVTLAIYTHFIPGRTAGTENVLDRSGKNSPE
jgi:integrase